MRLRDLKHLDAALEALTACVDADMLLGALIGHTRNLFHMEAAFVWLTTNEKQSRLHLTEGVPASVASRLQRLTISASGERTIARRLHKLGYRAVLAAPLRVQGGLVGLVAVGSQRSRRLSRIETASFHLMVRHAVSALERWQSPPMLDGKVAQLPMASNSDLDVQNERRQLINIFIAGITHDLNNAMAAIGGRVELLLNRLHDQATSPHLEAAHRAVVEASQMIRHIHNFVSGDREGGVVMVDVNQLVTDSVQIARSTWFQGFRQRRDPVDLATDLHPVPAVPARASDLRIILLCLLRHAMDTLRPGGRLIVRTSSMGGDEDQMVVVSLSDDPSQPSTAEREDEVELSRGQVHTPESRLALAVVQAMIRDLDGRITVRPSATGGTTTALVFAVNRAVAGER